MSFFTSAPIHLWPINCIARTMSQKPVSRDRLPPGIAPVAPLRLPRAVPRDYTRPTYAASFRCISSACEDTCCQGWSVPIDRATYEKYRSIDTLKSHLGSLIVLNTANPTPADHARIPLTATSTCPFLDPQHLCGIQKQLGPEALSVTCATYPRAISTVAAEREEALNLSCPEAARLTLLDPKLISPIGPSSYARLSSAEAQPAIREFALSLVADRRYPLWQRMYLLGILARRLETLSGARTVADWAEANPTTVAHMLADSARIATLQRLRPMMDDMQPQPAQQLQLVMQLLRIRLSQPPLPARFLECVQDFESGLRCNTANCEQDILTAYSDASRLYFKPFVEEHPHVLENYVINHIFKNHYPFTNPRDRHSDLQQEQPDAEVEHLVLSVHLAVIQTLLVGIAGYYREAFDSTHVIKLVQSFARTFEHSRESQSQLKAFLLTHQLNRLGGIAVLLQL